MEGGRDEKVPIHAGMLIACGYGEEGKNILKRLKNSGGSPGMARGRGQDGRLEGSGVADRTRI